MKIVSYIFPVLLLFIACDKETDNPISPTASLLQGKWIHNEAYISAGGPQYWVDVDNGEAIEFYKDGTFSSNRFTECDSGNFWIEENTLFLEYTCDEFETSADNEDGYITYRLEFFSDYFILTPTSGPICIEGCSYKYQKVGNTDN
ncbi:hypothetical protein [Maribacter thermophilus]|uniref:hypothetical protein n=1 Tax=Maribacter thermophilus TaxID=1197874 RepID=UPI0006412CA4|nr:hypothetical protein [Maribacter thermophilus]